MTGDILDTQSSSLKVCCFFSSSSFSFRVLVCLCILLCSFALFSVSLVSVSRGWGREGQVVMYMRGESQDQRCRGLGLLYFDERKKKEIFKQP